MDGTLACSWPIHAYCTFFLAPTQEARKRMQLKSFTTWINLHLAKVGMEVADLKTDFADGIKVRRAICSPSVLPLACALLHAVLIPSAIRACPSRVAASQAGGGHL